jgi:hypothetical protein
LENKARKLPRAMQTLRILVLINPSYPFRRRRGRKPIIQVI